QGSGHLSLRLGYNLGLRYGKHESGLLFGQSDRLLLATTCLFPGAGSSSPLYQALGLVEESFTWNSIEDQAYLPSSLGVDCISRADNLRRQGRTDDSRQSLGSAPAGDDANFSL